MSDSATATRPADPPHRGLRPPGPTAAGGRPSGRPEAANIPEPSVVPISGWHCGHFLYKFDRRKKLSRKSTAQFIAALSPDPAPARLATYWISGHEADFAVMAMDPDPAVVDGVHQSIVAPPAGGQIHPVWSFVSLSEVSEYVPTLDQFRDRLIAEGADPDSPELAAKVSGYERRLPMMNRQRLEPEIPEWPAACFYPMNKSRVPGANWFTEPFSRRREMMSEHAASGIAFAGKVSQLISVGVGLDDWEWMVTLWGKNPEYLKEIVYKMRFDIASAKYAQFGPFYVGYRADARKILEHCRVG